MKRINKKAFTLIEVIVVVAIIGILVLLGVPRFTGHTQRAELARIQHDVKVMEQEIGLMLINKDDDFNEWESNSKDFNQLIQENKLFDKEGPVEEVKSEDETYKVIPEKYKDKINTKLKGTFYANSDEKVYYEHVKPLFKNPTGSENPGPENPGEPGGSDEDVNNKEGLMNPVESREPNEDETAISTAEELAKIGKPGEEAEYPLNGKYILTDNIDLSHIENWTPIGDSSSKFEGSFDGNGYKITGLKTNDSSQNYVGLFGYTQEATISNVALEDISVRGYRHVGGLVGQAGSGSTISNSYVTGEITGKEDVGGFVGSAGSGSTISNSYAAVTVMGVGRGVGSQSEYVGGFAGGVSADIIENSYATGKVTGEHSVGGFAGITSYVSKISKSYATGKVTGNWDAGGFVGRANGGIMDNSYATGSVTGDTRGSGGFVGWVEYRTVISNSYSTGSVTGKEPTWDSPKKGDVGGFVGYVDGLDFPVNNSYWDTETSNLEESTGYYQRSSDVGSKYYNSYLAGVKGKSTDKMKQQTTFEGWDFDEIWEIQEGVSYPTLINNPERNYENPTGPENPDPENPGEPGGSDEDVNNKEGLINPVESRDPIEGEEIAISTAEELAKIGRVPEYPVDGKYILTADIDLSHIENWTPIGDSTPTAARFKGQFDGNGYKISNLTVNKTESDAGLFGYIYGDATIKNVALLNANVSGKSNVGALVGMADGGIAFGASVDGANIENSYATGSVTGTGGSVGGLVGWAGETTIENSYSTGSATGSYRVGGLVGDAQSKLTRIKNSYATGSVTGGNQIGGLVGSTSFYSIIENSYATGSVIGSSSSIGGLVGGGYLFTIKNSYATGSVEGVSKVGGLVGEVSNYATKTYIENSYAAGSVTGETDVYGLVGGVNKPITTSSYWDKETTKQTSLFGVGEGKTTAEMKNADTYSAWGTDVWNIVNGKYPTLK